MSGQLDIVVEQGSTFSRVITIKDSTGTPVNISNSTFRGHIRKRYRSETPEAVFTLTVTDGANGKLVMGLTDTETAAIESGEWVYDVEWVNGNAVGRLLEGTAYVTPEVTK